MSDSTTRQLTLRLYAIRLAAIVDHAHAHDKVAVFSETGYRTNPNTAPGDNARAAYWKNIILPAIMEDPSGKAQKIAWVLTWINATWSVPYIPHNSSTQEAKQNSSTSRIHQMCCPGMKHPICIMLYPS